MRQPTPTLGSDMPALLDRGLRPLLALATALFVAAGCSGGPSGERVGETSNAITPRYGVDYSFARPSPASIRAAGFTFAARYLSYTPAKDLSLSEANSLIAAGIDIVDNWEATSDAALDGYSQGASDAAEAQAEAAACGAPSTRPIYFSVDFDAAADQQAAIDDYFEGVASVIGLARTGAYGGYYVIQRLFDDGKITWGWQTYAWSGGQWDSRAQLRQILNGIDGDEEDEDEAVATDFGQWGTAAAPAPPAPTRGSLDSVTCDQISGWAQDPGSATTAIPVDLYLDGPAGSGTLLGRYTAGNARSDLCSAIGSCDHGFAVQPPSRLYDGHAHSVYAYGIAVTQGATNALLTGAPKTLDCAASLTGDFEGTGHTSIVQFRDDWESLPMCSRWGSEWSCSDHAATYIGGLGPGNGGSAIWGGATALVGDVNGDGMDDLLEFNVLWQSIPVCFSTGHAWSCENLKADYVGGIGAGNAGTGIYPGATPLVADVNGDGRADVIEYNSAWSSLPVCFATDEGWSCENLDASYLGGLGAGNAGSGVYGSKFGSGTTALVADVNGDGRADVIQYNPGWGSIPVCFSTGRGWSCENLEAGYVAGRGAGNSGSGIYASATTVRIADVNGDGRADVVQYSPSYDSIPVCFSTGRGWSCENLDATYVGGMGAGNSGSGVFPASDLLVADVNGDGNADLIQFRGDWQSIPVCFSTGKGFSCENSEALYAVAPLVAGNDGTAVFGFGVPLSGRFDGGKTSGVAQIDPGSGWTSMPLCTVTGSGWTCSSAAATVH
jgi:Domain of unknown function (DUF1906)/FG-GAP-like repeat